MLYGLETADQAAELFALASIIDSLFDHRLTCAKTVGGQDNTACITQPGRCNSPIISQWFRFGPVKPQFPDAAGAIHGSKRASLQARRLGTDKVQPATGLGANVGIISFEIEREQRSEEHTSELQSIMRISYAVFCLKKNKNLTVQ